MKKRLTLIFAFAFLSLGLDQITKMWARGNLHGHPALRIIDNYLFFEYHENPGMAFGLGRNLPGGRFILVVVGLLVLAIVWRIVRNVNRHQKLADIAYGLVAGGAIGNIVDRLWLGRVVDFIVMHWKHKHAWPAYNIADAALVVGVGIMLIAIAGEGREDATASAKTKDAPSKAPKSKRSKR